MIGSALHRDGSAPVYRNKKEMKETLESRGDRLDAQDWCKIRGEINVLKVLNTPKQSMKEKIERVLEQVPGSKDQNSLIFC